MYDKLGRKEKDRPERTSNIVTDGLSAGWIRSNDLHVLSPSSLVHWFATTFLRNYCKLMA